jgi:hypothetical protein
MPNIDAFNEIAARVLGRLLEAFPQGSRLHAEEFVDSSDKNAVLNFSYTVRFLATEELLRHEVASDDGEVFFEVILTGRGLAALHSTTDGAQGRQTFGQKLSDALEGGSPEALKSAVNELIRNIATGRI